jgi:hypothetical protein
MRTNFLFSLAIYFHYTAKKAFLQTKNQFYLKTKRAEMVLSAPLSKKLLQQRLPPYSTPYSSFKEFVFPQDFPHFPPTNQIPLPPEKF